jgi:vacuolar-type H+-ATPase subunit H
MSGQYATPNPTRPQIAYNLTIGNMDIQQTAKTFDTVRSLMPIAERAKGLFNGELSVVGALDEKNRPILNSINGRGKVTTNSVSIANFEPLNKIADALKMGEFKDIPLPRTVIQFMIKEGRVITEPFETTLAGTAARIEGSSGLDQSLAYTIGLAIPRDRLKGPALNAVNGLLGKVGALAGTTVQLPDPVKVNLLLGGTVPTPTVKLALAGGPATGSLGDAAKDALKDTLQEQLKTSAPDKVSDLADPAKAAEKAKEEAAKLLAEAEAQAQQIRETAKTSADKVKKEGYEAADKLVAEAGSNPIKKAIAQRTASALRKETDQKAQKIIDEGNANANKLVEEAKKKGGG